MNKVTRESGSTPVLALLIVLLFASLVSVGVAFADPPRNEPHSPAAQNNVAVQGTPTPTATCSPSWTTYPNPAPLGDSTLNGVTALAPDDMWAVGAFTSTDTITATTLTVHGNGAGWTYIPSPNPSSNKAVLHAVSGVASNDVWAVGEYIGGQYNQWETLTMHWDGTAWTIVPSPNNIYNNHLYSVTAISSNDVWAVGMYGSAGFHVWGLIEHWDGTSWSIVASSSGVTQPLYAVAAVSANDVWAVGGGIPDYPAYGFAIVEHWDGSTWSIVSSPQVNGSSLHAVTVVAANDVWAVGYIGGYGSGQTLTEHWDGTQWTVVDSPNPGANINLLYGVSARASNDVWAVGDTNQASGGVKTFALRWNGSAWSQVATPGNPTGQDQFYAVVGMPSSAVWAVGAYGCASGCTQNALISRYGTPCTITTPTTIPTNTRTATATATCTTASSPGPWAVGANYPWGLTDVAVASDGTSVYGFGGRLPNGDQRVAYKSTGSTWSPIADLPAAMSGAEAEYGHNGKIYVIYGAILYIYDIGTNSWSQGAPGPQSDTYFTGHAYWNGKVYVIGGLASGYRASAVHAYDIATDSWSPLAPLPQAEFGMAAAAINGKIYVANGNLGSVTDNLYIYDIATNSWSTGPPSPFASDLVGSTVIGGKLYMIGGDPQGTWWGYTSNTYLYDPASNSWSQGPSLNVARSRGNAATINTQGGQTTIVVGGAGGSPWLNSVEASSAPLVPCATTTVTPAASTTGTPSSSRTATRTITSVPPTNTLATTSTIQPTPTAQSGCTISFTDVPATNPFYSYIRCLACRGIVSGYADGTFRPDNLVTRGQLAKMVSNAGNFQEDPGPQIFNDVPSSQPFYQYINRLTNRGYMSGYTCGGVREPCPGSYFRPYANATRGQTSKIVANAAQIQDPIPSTQQTFEDVAPSYTFWAYIERLAAHGAIGGYNCGGPGEPCGNPPRPYFRPGNNVTRGQSAKIVGNTFFPTCETR